MRVRCNRWLLFRRLIGLWCALASSSVFAYTYIYVGSCDSINFYGPAVISSTSFNSVYASCLDCAAKGVSETQFRQLWLRGWKKPASHYYYYSCAPGVSWELSDTDNDGIANQDDPDPYTAGAAGTPPTISSSPPGGGQVGQVYEHTLTAVGDFPIAWTLLSGTLPPGLTLSYNSETGIGLLSGVPTVAGTFVGVLQASNDTLPNASQSFSIVISPAAPGELLLAATSPPGGTVGTAYTYTFTASGGSGPYTWSLESGALPDGLTLAATGVLSGTPTTAGDSLFTVSVTDGSATLTTDSLTLTIAPCEAETCTGEPGECDLYTPSGKTLATVWDGAKNGLMAAPVVNASSSFFLVSSGTQTCAPWVVPLWGSTSIELSWHCTEFIRTIFIGAGYVILLLSLFIAYRWAFL